MSKLAIIIPFYKIDFFEETIKSVASQTNKDFVLYIGNDASPDNPQSVIDKYFNRDEYQYLDYTENLGGQNLALQWERILENVTQEWFQILGDDDVLAPNFVDELYKSIIYCNSKNVYCIKTIHHHIDEHNYLIRINDYNIDTIEAKDFFVNKYLGTVSSSLSENVFKTEMYRKYHFEKIPLAWGSDDIAILSFSEYGIIYYNRNTYVKVRISSSSISGSESLNTKKGDAYNIFREKFIINHSKIFPINFVNTVLEQYLQYCYRNHHSAKYSVAFYYLKKLKLIYFLKTIKKVHYLK
jgi:glycosyltransferase involved in cell wall biosynthesis